MPTCSSLTEEVKLSSKIPLPDLPKNNYWVDPNTNPSTWNGVVPHPEKYMAAHKVEVCFLNLGQGSFRGLQTGRNDSVGEVDNVSFPWGREDDPDDAVTLT